MDDEQITQLIAAGLLFTMLCILTTLTVAYNIVNESPTTIPTTTTTTTTSTTTTTTSTTTTSTTTTTTTTTTTLPHCGLTEYYNNNTKQCEKKIRTPTVASGRSTACGQAPTHKRLENGTLIRI